MKVVSVTKNENGFALKFLYSLLERGGFRGGDLVTCHPLFSDMTLQNQILVIESLFLTSDLNLSENNYYPDNFRTCTPLATSLVKFIDNR